MACASLIVTACGGKQPPPAMPSVPVVVETVMQQDLPLTLKYPARVAGSRVVEVRARVSGVIVERTYKEGQPVKAGDILFRIEPENYQATYDQAVAQVAMQRATIDQARSDYERAQALVEEGAVSRREFDQAEAAFSQAKAGLAAAEATRTIARLNLDYTEVRSPVSGLASKEAVTVGNLVNGASGAGGDLLTTVVQADPAYVEFSLAEPEHLRLRELHTSRSAPLAARILGGSACAGSGVLDFSDTFVNPSTGTVRARAVFPNTKGCLVSGQYLSIELSGLTIPQAIAVPKGAVLFSQSGPMVWIVGENDIVSPRPVQIQESWEASWILHAGVQAGERVITEGLLKVQPGATVVALSPEQAARQKAEKAAAGASSGSASNPTAGGMAGER